MHRIWTQRFPLALVRAYLLVPDVVRKIAFGWVGPSTAHLAVRSIRSGGNGWIAIGTAIGGWSDDWDNLPRGK